MRIFLNDDEITIDELNTELKNLYCAPDGGKYEYIELVEIIDTDMYFEKYVGSIFG